MQIVVCDDIAGYAMANDFDVLDSFDVLLSPCQTVLAASPPWPRRPRPAIPPRRGKM